MKVDILKKSLLLASLSIISLSACAQKKTIAIAPYPSASPNATGVDNTQNIAPYQQGGSNPNQAYYGNGATLTPDDGSFSKPSSSASPSTTSNSSTSSTTSSASSSASSSAGSSTGDDLGLGTVPNLQPYTPPGGGVANGYTYASDFVVDQDTYPAGPLVAFLPYRNEWQATGIAMNGSSLLIAGSDNVGLLKSGTIISMSAETGKDWTKVGSKWLGSRNPMNPTIKGVAVDSSGKIYANDANSLIYTIDKPGNIVAVTAGFTGGIDLAVSGSTLIVATGGGLKKYDTSNLTTGSDFGTGVTPTGGICTDKDGNFYVIAGASVKKITSAGTVSEAVSGISNGVDVAVTDDGKIAVLSTDSVTLYDSKGVKSYSFGSGEFAAGKAIVASGSSLYVADFGTSYKDSKVVKYTTGSV